MSKHTPGPWNSQHRHVWARGTGIEDQSIADANGATDTQAIANARLIAQSPALLDIAERLLEICRWKCRLTDEDGKRNHETLVEACYIIARAKGESP